MGRVVDPETGFLYLVNRYYDPTTGQFMSRDPLVALTGSAYGYVDNNPLNGTDPTGLDANGGPPSSEDYLAKQNAGQASCPFPNDNDGGDRFVSGIFGFIGRLVTGKRLWGSAPTLNFQDRTQPPGDGWEWRGNGPVGSTQGSWFNPLTDQSLHPDLGHGPPYGPHYDYKGPDTGGQKVRLYPGDEVPDLPAIGATPPEVGELPL